MSSAEAADDKKLVHSSFRIKENVLKVLQKQADKRGISLSAFMNGTLENYVLSEMYFEELGFLLVSKDFLRKLFSKVTNKEYAEEFGRDLGQTISREYVTYFYPQVNRNTVVQFLDIWFRRFQSYQHRIDRVDNTHHYFTVNHDININYSYALKAMLEGLIEPIIKASVSFGVITSTGITFSFRI